MPSRSRKISIAGNLLQDYRLSQTIYWFSKWNQPGHNSFSLVYFKTKVLPPHHSVILMMINDLYDVIFFLSFVFLTL